MKRTLIENDDKKSEALSVACHPADVDRLQRERYRVFIEDIADGFFEIDLQGEFRFFNDAFCRILGRTARELKGRRFHDVMDSKNARLAVDSFFLGKAAGKQVAHSLLEIIRKDGRKSTLEVSARPIIDDEGQRIGYRGIARDVTRNIRDQARVVAAKKQIEKLYASSQSAERRYRAFLKFLSIPLLVHNMDHSVAYVNPAFEETFGWTRKDLELNPFAPIPDDQIKKTRTGKFSLLKNGVFYGLETKRLTKDGRVLDVIYDGSALYDQDQRPNGLVVTMRNVTQSKKDVQSKRALFNIAKALHQYSDLDGCLHFIVGQVQQLMNVRYADIVLVDEASKVYDFRAGTVADSAIHDDSSRTQIPLEEGFAGQVIQTNKPRIVNKIDDEDLFRASQSKPSITGLRNLLGVPMQVENRTIGAIIAANKNDGDFDHTDAALLGTIAGMVSLPIENARINEALRNSYEEIQALNRAKDGIIDHLSHEIRTPISVLSATLKMLQESDGLKKETTDRIIARGRRNLQRIIDMQSKLKDIIREPDTRVSHTLTQMLDLWLDELEALVEAEGGPALGPRIRRRIEDDFGPRSPQVRRICLGDFMTREVEGLKPQFAERRIEFSTTLTEDSVQIELPTEILSKIVTGMLRNAVEYTPDGGKVEVFVRSGEKGAELVVSDTGVGITEENQKLISGGFFTTRDAYHYGTGKPFAFNAGGRGFDLLRMRVFSERYGFTLSMRSKRCVHIPTDKDICPGDTQKCAYCESAVHCHYSGGTIFTVRFPRGEGEMHSGVDPVPTLSLHKKNGERFKKPYEC